LGTQVGRIQVPDRGAAPVLIETAAGGFTTLVSDAPIQMSTDGITWKDFMERFMVDEPTRLHVRARGFTGVIALEPPPLKMTWKAEADSFQPNEGEPQNAIDGNPDTFWHTQWNPRIEPSPHYLQLFFGKVVQFKKIFVTGRRNGNENGSLRDYEVFVSQDGKNWGESVMKGKLSRSEAKQTIELPAVVTARYLKMVVLTTYWHEGFVSISEIDVGR